MKHKRDKYRREKPLQPGERGDSSDKVNRRDAAMFRFIIEHLPPGTFEDCEVDDADSWRRAIAAAMAKDKTT